MPEGYALTQQQVERLQEALKYVEGQRIPSVPLQRDRSRNTTDCYICKTNSLSGIAKVNRNFERTGTGLGSFGTGTWRDDDEVDSQTCRVFKIEDPDGTGNTGNLLVDTNVNVRVWNVSSTGDVPANSYFLATKDKFGNWITTGSAPPATTCRGELLEDLPAGGSALAFVKPQQWGPTGLEADPRGSNVYQNPSWAGTGTVAQDPSIIVNDYTMESNTQLNKGALFLAIKITDRWFITNANQCPVAV